MDDKVLNDMAFSEQAYAYLEWQEGEALEYESGFLESDPDEQARLMCRSNAYSRVNVHQTRWTAITLSKIERLLIDIKRSLQVIASATVLICVVVILKALGWWS